MKIQLLLLFSLLSQISFGQTFSEKWRADSLGENGFRKERVTWDSVKKEYLINGISLNGSGKNNLIASLGKPNLYGSFRYEHGVSFFRSHTHRTRQTIIYYLNGKNSILHEDEQITFVIRKKKVFYLNQHYIKRFEEHHFLGCLLSNSK